MTLSRTRSIIEQGIQGGLHIGAQVYVWRRGEVAADWATGVARPARPGEAGEAGETKEPELLMTPDTIIVWLSSGKPITAVAVAQLWERGLLEIDDPVARFIPAFAQNGKEHITLRHLLTHTAPLRLVDTGWPAASWDQIIARICAARPEPRWIPGRTAGYGAHAAWFILGDIVQRLGGEPIGQYIRRHILLPCGMKNSFLSMTLEEQALLRGRMAVMQQTEPGKENQLDFEPPDAIAVPRPGASMRGPARELGLFYRMLHNRGVPAVDSGRRVLLPQTVEAITARHRAGRIDKTFGTIIDWGLGFLINSSHYGNPAIPYGYVPHAGRRTFGHSGNQSSTGFCDPENGVVAAIVFNGWPGESIHQQRIRATLEAVYCDLGIGD